MLNKLKSTKAYITIDMFLMIFVALSCLLFISKVLV